MAFSWLCGLLLPFLFSAACYARLFYAGLDRLAMSYDSSAETETTGVTRALATATAVTLVCYVPHMSVNLLAGRGVPIPASVHFAAATLLLLGFISVAAAYVLYGELRCALNLPNHRSVCCCNRCCHYSWNTSRFRTPNIEHQKTACSPARQKLLSVHRHELVSKEQATSKPSTTETVAVNETSL